MNDSDTTDQDTISRLMDRIREAEESDKNRRNLELWGGKPSVGQDHWRGRPAPGDTFPVTIEPEVPMWAKILDFSVKRFYTEPREYLRRNLEMALWRFDRWDENTCIGRDITIWLGVTFEVSLFGIETIYQEDVSPWISKTALLKEAEDLKALQKPDFWESGLMPLAHRFYEEIGELLDDDFSVEFPDWGRSPFSICTHLRGTEGFLTDMLVDREFAHNQLEFVTECRKEWLKDRVEFLGEELEPGDLYNDEVNGELFAPRLYEQFILPTEIELSEFQGGIAYWHSCGDTTDFCPLIDRIPDLDMFHVSPWADIEEVVRLMGGDHPLEVCLDPLRDVQRPEAGHQRKHLERIRSACQGTAYTVRADGLHVIDNLERELKAIDDWLECALQVRGAV